jgi:single-strand DNA-binding protein
MASFNRVVLMGNLTRDPELSFASSGTPVCKFGLAINRKWKDREEVCFIDVVSFGKQAEILNQYLRKGGAVLVEGRLTYSSWEDKNSQQRRSKNEVVVENFSFLPKAGAAADQGAGDEPPRDGDVQPPADGDIPF